MRAQPAPEYKHNKPQPGLPGSRQDAHTNNHTAVRHSAEVTQNSCDFSKNPFSLFFQTLVTSFSNSQNL